MPEIERTEEEWRTLLTPAQFQVLRQAGTERAWTGPYLDEHTPGTYHCAACDNPLFESSTKFDSHCGWPSFFRTLGPESVDYLEDHSHGMTRVEVRCHRCGSHLGHVFPDGPPPTGRRYCMNGIALSLQPLDATAG